MEPKKLKKLVLKKETIANLSSSEQNRLKGGGSDGLVCLVGSVFFAGADAQEACAYFDKPKTNTYLYSVPYAAGECPNDPPPQSGYQWCPSVLFYSCNC